MTVKCIDNKNKPNEIPTSKWVKKDQEYNVIEIVTDREGVEGYILEEIDLTGCLPYNFFAAYRFEILDNGLGELLEEIGELENTI